MPAIVHAIYINGVFAPTKQYKLKLREGQAVELLIKKFSEAKRDPAYDLSDLAVETGIRDLASEHDHYLYGTPKRGKRNARKTRIR